MKVRMNKVATYKSETILKDIISNIDNWTDYNTEDMLLANKCLSRRNNVDSIDIKVRRLTPSVTKLWKSPSKYSKGYTEKDDLMFVCSNSKTAVSIDFSNTCIYKCSYCYIQSEHAKSLLATRGEWSVPSYYLTPNRENRFRLFLNWYKENLPGKYPLRFFSIGDCSDNYIGLLQKLLRICKEENVKTVVISKNETAIKASYGIADSTLYSVDIGKYNSPTSFKRYIQLQKEMENLIAFLMVVDFDELTAFQFMIKYSGIPTENFQFVAYHGTLIDMDSSIDTNIKPMFLNILTNGNACCATTNKCIGCHLKCGLGKRSNDKYTLYRNTKCK